METITMNGKEYISTESFNKDYVKKEDFNNSSPSFKILNKDSTFTEESNVLGIGTVKIEKGYVGVKLSTEFLEKVIKCLKSMSMNKKGIEGIYLAWGNDYPAIIGNKAENTDEITGFIIAPRIDTDS